MLRVLFRIHLSLNVSIWFLVAGLSLFLCRLTVYSVLHALGHYLITEMSSNALAAR
jgi:hypothetical protein